MCMETLTWEALVLISIEPLHLTKILLKREGKLLQLKIHMWTNRESRLQVSIMMKMKKKALYKNYWIREQNKSLENNWTYWDQSKEARLIIIPQLTPPLDVTSTRVTSRLSKAKLPLLPGDQGQSMTLTTAESHIREIEATKLWLKMIRELHLKNKPQSKPSLSRTKARCWSIPRMSSSAS